nr:hypothetical protein [Tanacetum cinerariifolium]
MREKRLATWDGGKVTWGGRVGVLSTVPMCVCIGKAGVRDGFLEGSFSPSGNFEIFTYLVPGLWLLSFDGLGFDLLARTVPKL